jgi:hypothetical protein
MATAANEVTRLQLGESHVITVMAHDSTGVGVTGATVQLRMRRVSDGFYFNGTTFAAGVSTLNMSQLDSSNMPGVYTYLFPGAALAEPATLIYAVTCTGVTVANEPWYGQIKVGGWVDYVDASISVVQESVIFIPTILGVVNGLRSSLVVVDQGIKGVFRVVQDIVARLGQILLRTQ